jgi:hypothetical protein
VIDKGHCRNAILRGVVLRGGSRHRAKAAREGKSVAAESTATIAAGALRQAG